MAEGRQVGYRPQTETQIDATLEGTLTSFLKELITDFFAVLFHYCILEGCKLDENGSKQRQNQSWCLTFVN